MIIHDLTIGVGDEPLPAGRHTRNHGKSTMFNK